MAKKDEKNLSPVERLIHSLESRIGTYQKNKARLTGEYKIAVAIQDRKIADCKLQVSALTKK